MLTPDRGTNLGPGPAPVFLVPYRSDGGWRDQLWRFVQSWWEEQTPGATFYVGASPAGPFNRSAAINAAARSGPWDTAVVLDADVVAAGDQVLRAVEIAEATGRLTLAFDRYVGLNRTYTVKLLNGWRGDLMKGKFRTSDAHESSIVAVRRDLWEEVGGFDERFVGWGQEDVSFAHTARLLRGWIERTPGKVYHLWHARSYEARKNAPTYAAVQALGKRYHDLTTADGARALLRERESEHPTADL